MVAYKKIVFIFLASILLHCTILKRVSAQNTNTYTNPIIHEDFSDPDVIRVGNWFYMTASSFTSVPGLPILRSSDLVHWQLIGHALKNNVPADYYKKVQHGAGVWAPSLRFHNGEFYIYYPDPDFGIYVIKAKNITGPWTTPQLVLEGKGLIDPCPLWDDNGKVYLVHAYAGSRAGIKSVLAIKEMNKEGTAIIEEGKLVYDGHGIDPTVEGPKLYKRNGWYYIFAPAGGVATGWQIVLRSKNIYGPYERKKVMEQGTSPINGPHQGAWVQTNTGEDWFIHFQDKEAYGRITHLQPMNWINDWPVIGLDNDGDGIGEPVLMYTAPKMKNAGTLNTTNLVNQKTDTNPFQWNATPEFNWSMNYENSVRHYAIVKKDTLENLWNFPAMYLRKLPAENFSYTAQLHFNSLQIGERAGLIVFGKSYAAIELKNTKEGLQLNYVECNKADKGNAEKVTTILNNCAPTIYVRMTMTQNATVRYSYSMDGIQYTATPFVFNATPGIWVGAKMGFYCSSEKSTNDAGYIEIKSSTVNIDNAKNN
jgi:beta-xylosidase